MNPNDPTPGTPDTPWEEAMSRDFDARVRDLHEAPLDFTSVKGKARKIRRNRRAAVAGGILGVAAIVTPVAVLAGNGDDTHSEAPFVERSDSTGSTQVADPAGADYLEGRTWHQADGDVVELPKGNYYEAGVWDDQLVTLQPWGEVYSRMTVFDQAGATVDHVDDVVGFATSADQSILAYTRADGQLIARWDGGQSVLAEDVTDSAGGESVGGAPVSVVGTAPCEPESGSCLVRINTDTGGCRGVGSSDVPLPGSDQALQCFDEQDGLLTFVDERHDDGVTCGGVWSSETLDFLWHGCDYQAQDISPDGRFVVGAPSQYDGLGYPSISALDAQTGTPGGTYAPEGGFIWSEVAWTADSHLLLTAYDGAGWHLFSMQPEDGAITELATSNAGDEVTNPFVLVRH